MSLVENITFRLEENLLEKEQIFLGFMLSSLSPSAALHIRLLFLLNASLIQLSCHNLRYFLSLNTDFSDRLGDLPP